MAIWFSYRRAGHAALAAAFFLTSMFAAAAAPKKKAGPVLGNVNQPMQFAVVRSSDPACEPLCPEWIWARGEITASTPAAFKRFLKKIGKKRLPVVISSPGGSIEGAMAVGRMIRERKLDTGVGTAYLTGCAADDKECIAKEEKSGVYKGRLDLSYAFCNSACPLVLAGGTKRLTGRAVFVGVHQITTTYYKQKVFYREKYKVVKGKKKVVSKKIVRRKQVGSYNSTKLPKASERKMLAYLKEMGIAKSYFTVSQRTPAKEIRRLDPLEMFGMNLTTGREGAEIFAKAERCGQIPFADNCVGVSNPGVATNGPSVRKVKPKIAAAAAPMQFAIVRSSETGCEPICPEWISAEGKIGPETPALLAQVLKGLGGRHLPIVLTSLGGDADAAMAVGRMIRQHGLSVALGKTTFSGCQPGEVDCQVAEGKKGKFLGRAGERQNYCASECALVMAGGSRRFATDGSIVILHLREPEPNPALKQRLAEYLAEMGIEKTLLTAALGPIGSDLDPPTLAQMYAMKLATDRSSVESLTAATTCAVSSTIDNCSLFTTQNQQ